MSYDLIEVTARALRAHGATPRQTKLVRHRARAVTANQAAHALTELAQLANSGEPLVGWWQDPDTLSHTGLCAAVPDVATLAHLLEGEWTVGPTTLKLRRSGADLIQSCLSEQKGDSTADSSIYVQPALAQRHTFIGRNDLRASQIELMVYSVWDEERQQVIPVAQRLLSITSA